MPGKYLNSKHSNLVSLSCDLVDVEGRAFAANNMFERVVDVHYFNAQ